MSNQKRRSLFEEGGVTSYRDKITKEVEEYLKILDEFDQDPTGSILEHRPITKEQLLVDKPCTPLPDLDLYIKTVTEFLQKDAIFHQQREEMMKKLKNLPSQYFQ